MRTNVDLIAAVERRATSYLGGLPRSPRVLNAMRRVDRRLFLPAGERALAYEDHPVPIGHGQTCSEPSMVAFMLDILELHPGQRVLEIGSGSGYAAAIAALLCAPTGTVFACEVVASLAELMGHNFAAWKADRLTAGDSGLDCDIRVLAGDGSAGFPQFAPFDAIFFSAGVNLGSHGFSEGPLLAQLASEGVLVYPEAFGQLFQIKKMGVGVRRTAWSSVSFVPLRGQNS